MPTLPQPTDPTLEAVDVALVEKQRREPNWRLGITDLIQECERAGFYAFRWVTPREFDAASIKRFEDGYRGEEVMAARLRMVEGVELWVTDPDTGKQFEVLDCDGHVRGKIDGAVLGILQAPKTWHTWEHKVVDEKKAKALEKAKQDVGEKDALRIWDIQYYHQAVYYMFKTGMKRHYLTCDTPGSRRTVSVRTETDVVEALKLQAKAKRIVFGHRPTERIGGETHWKCKLCTHFNNCHGDSFAQVNCRTCLSSTPIENGQWKCEKFNRVLTIQDQKDACDSHLFLPDLIPGEQIDCAEDWSWIKYKLRNGEEWVDGKCQK